MTMIMTMIFLIEAYVGTSVPSPAGVRSVAFAHFGENRQHLLHGEMGFIAHADHEQIVHTPIILQRAL